MCPSTFSTSYEGGELGTTLSERTTSWSLTAIEIGIVDTLSVDSDPAILEATGSTGSITVGMIAGVDILDKDAAEEQDPEIPCIGLGKSCCHNFVV